MRPRSVLSVLPILLPLALLLTACEVEVGSLSAGDIAAIRSSAEQEVVEATLAGDWDRFAAGFTEDAVRMPPNEPLHQGRDAIKQWAEANWGPLTTTEFTMTVEDVVPQFEIVTNSPFVTDPIFGTGTVAPNTGSATGVLDGGPSNPPGSTGVWNAVRGGSAPIPTLNLWGIVTFVLAMMLSGLYFLRRRGSRQS